MSKFLLVRNQFISEMYLRQPGFRYSACGLFTKNRERIRKIRKQQIQDIFIKTYQKKLVFCISSPIGANGKPLAAIGTFLDPIGKLMTGKTLAINWEELDNAIIGNDELAV